MLLVILLFPVRASVQTPNDGGGVRDRTGAKRDVHRKRFET